MSDCISVILDASGVPYRKTRYPKPPSGAYAVYMDDIETDGPDGLNMIYRHDATVELYSSAPDPTSESKIESALDAKGVRWTKQSPYWITEEQLYQVIYEFTIIQKGGTSNA